MDHRNINIYFFLFYGPWSMVRTLRGDAVGDHRASLELRTMDQRNINISLEFDGPWSALGGWRLWETTWRTGSHGPWTIENLHFSKMDHRKFTGLLGIHGFLGIFWDFWGIF